MGPDNKPEPTGEPVVDEVYEAMHKRAAEDKATEKRRMAETTPQSRQLGLLVGWVLKDRFADAVHLVEYAKRKQIPIKNVAPWLEASVDHAAYGDTVVKSHDGKKFVISVREVEN